MKLDKFLAAIFSKKTVAILLLVVVISFSFTACELTFEDVFYLAAFGCLSFDTCRALIWECGDCVNCAHDTCVLGFEGCTVECKTCAACVGDSNNLCFNFAWNSCLKDCRPSTICNNCGLSGKGCGSIEDNEDDYYYDDTDCTLPTSCDDCMLDCLDCYLKMCEGN